jgi:hypothetical protein
MGMIVNPYIGGGGGGSGIAAARIRFQDGAVTSDGKMRIQEIQFLDGVGGTDQCTGGTAFASSNEDGFRVPANCFDNTNGNEWGPNGPYNSHVGYTFAAPVADIPEFTVKINSIGTDLYPPAMMLEVLYSGDSEYTRYAEVTGLTWTANEIKTFTVASYPTAPKSGYTKHKIVVTASNDGNGDVLASEIGLLPTVGGAAFLAASSALARASGSAGHYSSGEGPDKAFNNNTGDWWQPRITGGGTVECIWDYGTDNDRELAQVRWRCHPSFLGRTPNAFTAYGWNGSSWVQIGSPVSCGTWSGNDRTFTL